MILIIMCSFIIFVECSHIFNVGKDFNRALTDNHIRAHASEVLKKLQAFRVAVHPRMRLFYQLLKKRMLQLDHQRALSLYNPNVYMLPLTTTSTTNIDLATT